MITIDDYLMSECYRIVTDKVVRAPIMENFILISPSNRVSEINLIRGYEDRYRVPLASWSSSKLLQLA